MTIPFDSVSFSSLVSTTEFSLWTGSNSGIPTAQTTLITDAYVFVDARSMLAGDQFNVVIYEKVNAASGGTQAPVVTFPLVGARTEQDVFGPFCLGEGWDITIKKIAGTDRTIKASIRYTVGNANAITANLTQWLGTAPATLNSQMVQVAVMRVGQGAAADYPQQGNEGEVWPRAFKVSEATAARRTIFFSVLAAPNSGSLAAHPVGAWEQVYKRSTVAEVGAASLAAMLVPRVGKNGGALSAAIGTLAQLTPDGFFSYVFDPTELNTAGYGVLEVGINSPDGIVQGRTIPFLVTAVDPFDSVRFGLSALPNAAANAAGGLAGHITHAGTAQAGAASTITLAASSSALASFYNGQIITILSGTGAGQSARIKSFAVTTHIATIDGTWITNPDSTSVYIIEPDSGQLADSAITSAKIASGAITSTGIAASAIGASQLASAAITSAKFATDAIDSNALAASAVTEIQTGLATSASVVLLQADTDDIQTRLPAALDGSGFMKSQVKGIDSTALDLIFNYAVENSKTFVQYLRVIKSALVGKLAVSGTSRTFRDDADTKARITATADATGRTAVAIDGT